MVKQKEKMNIARVNTISKFEGQVVQLNGWVYNSRRSGKIGFLMLRDGFGIIQCIVAKNDVGEEKFNVFKLSCLSIDALFWGRNPICILAGGANLIHDRS